MTASTLPERRRALLLAGAACASWPLGARAQADWQRVAVPLYDARDFVAGFLRSHALPRAQAWAKACERLVQVLAGPDAPDQAQARQAWHGAATTWSALAAVSTGPLLTRRSARRVDFHPVRVPLLERALAQAPASEDAMERVGSAAKGLAALEWLLWSPAAPRDAGARAYAAELARDLQREADALAAAFREAAEAELDDEATVRWFAEIVNQWIGALEQLRLSWLLRPVDEAAARGRREPVWIRPLARSDAAERAARWQAVQALALFGGGSAPPRGQGLPVPIETTLRGRGLNPLADRLRRAMQATGAAMHDATPGQVGAMRRAARGLGELKHLAEADLAPALEVRVGFSDADGD